MKDTLLDFLIVVSFGFVLMVLGACSITSVNRDKEGRLVVTHRTFLIKTEAPSLEVERDNVNEYKAKFNAKSRGGDLEAMAEILKMFIAVQTPTEPE